MAQQNQSDGTMEIIMVIIALLVAGWLISHFFGNDIAAGYLWVKMQWVKLYMLVFNNDTLNIAYNSIDIYTPKEWTYSRISDLAENLKFYIAVPLIIIFGIFSYSVINKNPSEKFSRVLSRKKLLKSEVTLWPWVYPILNLDLAKEPIDKGKWAMNKKPLDFCKKYNLLIENNNLDGDRAEKLFSSQLGALWDGHENLPNYAKALFACFIAQICNDKDGSRDGLKQLALTMDSTPNYEWVDGLIKKHINYKLVKEATSKNAYTINVLCSVLEAARLTGVLPPSYFIWLRPIDPVLWSALNCVGRRTPFCEIAGIFGHNLAEKQAGHPMEKPYVQNAVEALKKALEDVKID